MRGAQRRGNPPVEWNQVTITTKNRGDSHSSGWFSVHFSSNRGIATTSVRTGLAMTALFFKHQFAVQLMKADNLNWCLSGCVPNYLSLRTSPQTGVAIPRLEEKCTEKYPEEWESPRFLVVIVTWFHSTRGLPHHLSGLVRNHHVQTHHDKRKMVEGRGIATPLKRTGSQ